jgi:hypothetical protein
MHSHKNRKALTDKQTINDNSLVELMLACTDVVERRTDKRTDRLFSLVVYNSIEKVLCGKNCEVDAFVCALDSKGLYHPLDGITNPKYKLLHFLTIIIFTKKKKEPAFNWDRFCHLALCLWMILLNKILFQYFVHIKTQNIERI